MQARSTLSMLTVIAGILVGLGVAFGPWLSSLVVDDPSIDVDGPFNAVLLILGALFALPAIVTIAVRRRFAATTLRTVVAVVVNVGVTLFELLMVAVMVTDDSGDGQIALILIVPIPVALVAAFVLGIIALVARRPVDPGGAAAA